MVVAIWPCYCLAMPERAHNPQYWLELAVEATARAERLPAECAGGARQLVEEFAQIADLVATEKQKIGIAAKPCKSSE